MENIEYRHFSTQAEYHRQIMEGFEEIRRRIPSMTREEAGQYLRDAGVYHLFVGPKRRSPWRTKSKRRKEKDAEQLRRLKRRI